MLLKGEPFTLNVKVTVAVGEAVVEEGEAEAVVDSAIQCSIGMMVVGLSERTMHLCYF